MSVECVLGGVDEDLKRNRAHPYIQRESTAEDTDDHRWRLSDGFHDAFAWASTVRVLLNSRNNGMEPHTGVLRVIS